MALPIIAGIVKFVAAVTAAVKAVAAIKILGTALTVGKLFKAVQIVAFLASLRQPKLPSTGQELSLTIDPNAGLPIAFGRRMTAGNLAYKKTWKGDSSEENNTLGKITILSAGGTIEAIQSVQIGDNVITNWDGNPQSGLATVKGLTPSTGRVWTYKDRYKQRWSKGDQSGSIATLTGMPTGSGHWVGTDSNFKFTNFAFIAEVARNHDQTFKQGESEIKALIKGLRWYDPRKDSSRTGGLGAQRYDDPATYGYNENGFIIAYNLLRGRLEKTASGDVVRTFGLHLDDADIDLEAFITGANVADAFGWTVHGIPSSTDGYKAIIDKLLVCSGGVLLNKSAQISCLYASPKAAVLTITDDDLISDFNIDTGASYRDKLNSIVAEYPEPLKKWEPYFTPALTVDEYVEEDGEEKSGELKLDFVTNIDQAYQLAALELTNSREFLSYELTCKPRLLQVEVGEAVNVQINGLSLASQKCLVISKSFDLVSGTVKLKLRSETDSKYDFIAGLQPEAPESSALVSFAPALIPDAPAEDNWTVSPIISGGIPALLVQGSTDDDQESVGRIVIEYRESSASEWILAATIPVDLGRYVITGLKPLTGYDVAISYVSQWGELGQKIIFEDRITASLISTGTQNVGDRPVQDIIDRLDDSWLAASNAVSDISNVSTQLLNETNDRIAAITAEANARANAIQTMADDLHDELITLTNGVDFGVVSELSNSVQTLNNTTVYHQLQINGLVTQVDGKAYITDLNAVRSNVTVAQGSINSQGSRLTGIENKVNHSSTGLDAKASQSALTAVISNVSATQNGISSAFDQINSVRSDLSVIGSQNLAPNPAFLEDTGSNPTGWTSGVAVIPGTNANSLHDDDGVRFLRQNVTGITNASDVRLYSNVVGRAPVIAGRTYTFSIYIRTSNGRARHQLIIGWIGADGAAISYPSATQTALNINEWTRLTLTSTAPDGAVAASMFVINRGNNTTPLTCTIDHMKPQFEEGSQVTGWRDNVNSRLSSSVAAIDALSVAQAATANSLNSEINRINTITNRIGSRTNLLPNGGLVNGLNGWNRTLSQIYFTNDPSSWGPVMWRGDWTTTWSGTAVIYSDQVPVYAGTTYTFSADTICVNGNNSTYLDMLFYNSAGAVLLDSGQIANVTQHDFDPTDQKRFTYACTATAPAGAVSVSCRVVFNVTNSNVFGFRRAKLEQGTYATNFSNESSEFALATYTSSINSNVTSIGSTVSGHTSSISALNLTVGNQNSSITNLQSLTTTQNGKITKLEAKAGVTVDVNGRVTGWSLNNNGQSGMFDVMADRVRFFGSGTVPTVSFEVDTVQNILKAKNLSVENLTLDTLKAIQSTNSTLVLPAIAMASGTVENITDTNTYTSDGTAKQRFVKVGTLWNRPTGDNNSRSIRNGNVTVSVQGAASVDYWFSIWYEVLSSNLSVYQDVTFICRGRDDAGGVSNVGACGMFTTYVPPDGCINFYLSVNESQTNQNAGTGTRSMHHGTFLAHAVNFTST